METQRGILSCQDGHCAPLLCKYLTYKEWKRNGLTPFLFLFIYLSFVSTLPIRNGNSIIFSECYLKLLAVSTLPIRNGNCCHFFVLLCSIVKVSTLPIRNGNRIFCNGLTPFLFLFIYSKYLTYKEWKHLDLLP